MTGEKSGEYRAKTVEAAVNAGLAALRLSREEVEVEVVRPGSRGVLGIGAEDAVVRLTVIRGGRTEPAPKPAPEPEAAPTAKPQRESTAQAPAKAAKSEPKPASSRQDGKQATGSQAQPVKKTERKKAPPSGSGDAGTEEKGQAAIEQGKEFLAGMLDRMGLRATVEVVEQSEAETDEGEQPVMVLNIVGEDLGVLIGRQNEVLSSLEFITRLMVNQQSHTRSSFIVDVNGYRAKRAESLRKLALRTAEQVIQSGRTMALEPMPPSERRIIHLALRDHPSVETQSVGEGDRRKVTVVLKK